MKYKNVDIDINANPICAAWYGHKVELYGENYTIIIKTKSTKKAKKIFKKYGCKWEYEKN